MSMELRMLLAIVLSFVVFFLFQKVFHKEPPQQDKEISQQVQDVEKETVAIEKESKALDEKASQLDEETPQEVQEAAEVTESQRQARTLVVSTPLYVAEFTEKGAGPKTFKLKKFKESSHEETSMKELIELPGEGVSTLAVSFLGNAVRGLKGAVFDAGIETDVIDVKDSPKKVTFTWTSVDGITVLKTYTFLPETYEIDLEIKVENRSAKAIEENLTISLKNGLETMQDSRYVFTGPAAMIDGKLEEIDVGDIEDKDRYEGLIKWMACEDQYFVSAVMPQEARKAGIKLKALDDILVAMYVDPSGPVLPNTERTYGYRAYFGPKSLETLNSAGADLSKILDFGFFDIIAKPLLHAMNFIYRFIPNYGVAIILITIMVKLLFWPLSNKSYKSMSEMKKLQPKMAEIRAKYKDDKKTMNQEIMGLYKLYKINPLGGCLPMVFQIPVFFAFYKMLYQAIELRHAPFCLWINDLSAPDRLFSFDFSIPMMTPPYGIPILTIIMGASMFFQQKMSPPPGDPTQAKMMMMMPIFFTFIFINFPSGLVLYWLVNNILSMAQQYHVSKKTR